MIYEEPDLGERMIRAGYTIEPCFAAHIWHPVSKEHNAIPSGLQSSAARIPKERLYDNRVKAYLFFRNRIIYMSLYTNTLQFLIFYCIFNPLLFFYYLPSIRKRLVPVALLGVVHATLFAVTKNRQYIASKNHTILHI
jgi:GT2 family glycosyltransferase